MTTQKRVFNKLFSEKSKNIQKLSSVMDIVGGQSQLNERFINALKNHHAKSVASLDNLQAAMTTLEDDAHDLLVQTKEVYDKFKDLGHEGGMKDMEQYTDMLSEQKRKCKAMAQAAQQAIEQIDPKKVF